MKKQNKLQSIKALSIIVFFLMLSAAAAYADEVVYAPNSAPFNIKFQEWSAQWWQFVLSLPVADNPLVDETGAKCAVGQRGPVWFLVGSFGGSVTRTCSIPAGESLFFPVLNLVDINVTNQTAAELQAEIAPCLDAVTALAVEIDGQSIKNLTKKFRVTSEVFAVTVPENGFLDPGTYSPVVDDGFYVMLKPLALGPHTLHISAARQGCPFSPDPLLFGRHVSPYCGTCVSGVIDDPHGLLGRQRRAGRRVWYEKRPTTAHASLRSSNSG